VTQPRSLPSAERRIFFYRLDAGLDDDGIPVDVDLSPVLIGIGRLPFEIGGRYVPGDGDTITSCWVDAMAPRARVRLATIRRSGLPQLEDTGNLRPLLIGPREGVAEQIHIVLFREVLGGVPTTIVGSEFNFYGPRISRFAHYLWRHAAGSLPSLTFRPLVRRDASEALSRLTDIRLFRLRITRAYLAEVTSESASLGAAFEAAEAIGEADEYEILVRPRPRSRGHIGSAFLSIARRLARRDDIRSGASSFEVRGRDEVTGHVEALDLLSDKLIAKRQILREDDSGRALNSAAAFAAIEDAYEDLRNELLTAASAYLVAPDATPTEARSADDR
jgi:hypothetical protein